MSCLRGPCPSAAQLTGRQSDPDHRWMAARKKKLTHALMEAGHSRGYLQNLWSFYFTSSSPLPLCAIKETGIQTPIRWFFRDTSLPSPRSASFPNKVAFLASTPHLRFIGLSCCKKQSELGLGNNSSYFLNYEEIISTKGNFLFHFLETYSSFLLFPPQVNKAACTLHCTRNFFILKSTYDCI